MTTVSKLDAGRNTITFTIATSVKDMQPKGHSMTWAKLCEQIANAPPQPTKAQCRMLMLKRLGKTPNPNGAGSLRHDGNVLAITGVTGDYDAGKMPMEAAAEKLKLAGVQAFLHTSASNTPKTPRWRVLCPLSVEAATDQNETLVGRLNAILGGVLSTESFTLSQPFYFGPVKGAEYRTLAVDGEYLDRVQGDPQYPVADLSVLDKLTEDELRERVLAGDEPFMRLPSLTAKLAHSGVTEAGIVADVQALLSRCPHPRASVYAKEVPRMAKSAVEKFGKAGGTLIVTMADQIEPRSIDWAWKGRLAYGMMHLIIGIQGDGKSIITCDLAASFTKGRHWPDMSIPSRTGTVLMCCVEDDLYTEVRPRLDLAGADVSRVGFIGGITTDKGTKVFSLQDDLAAVRTYVKAKAKTDAPVVAVFFDPFTAYLGGSNKSLDSYRDEELRPVIVPWVEVARELEVVLVFVGHLNKTAGGRAIHRMLGGQTMSMTARRVFLIAPLPAEFAVLVDSPTSGGVKIFADIKNNGKPNSGLMFVVESHVHPVLEKSGDTWGIGKIKWQGETQMTAEQVLSSRPSTKQETPLQDAIVSVVAKAGGQGLRSIGINRALGRDDKDATSAGFRKALGALVEEGKLILTGYVYTIPVEEDLLLS